MSLRTCAWRLCAIALVSVLVGCGGGSAASTSVASGSSGGGGATGGTGSSGGTGGSGGTTVTVTGVATPKAVSVVTAN